MKIGDKVKLKDGVNAPDPDCLFGDPEFTFFTHPEHVMTVVGHPDSKYVDLKDTVNGQIQGTPRTHIEPISKEDE